MTYRETQKALGPIVSEALRRIKDAPNLATAQAIYDRENKRLDRLYNAGVIGSNILGQYDIRLLGAIIAQEIQV